MMMMKWYLNDQGNLVQSWNSVKPQADQPVVQETDHKHFSYANSISVAKDKNSGGYFLQNGLVAIV